MCDRLHIRTVDASPDRRDWHAMWNATRLLEQAVSMWTLGPLRSKYQLTRFATSEDAVPVAAVFSALSGSCDAIFDQSSVKDAENTDVLEPLRSSAGIPASTPPAGVSTTDFPSPAYQMRYLTIFKCPIGGLQRPPLHRIKGFTNSVSAPLA